MGELFCGIDIGTTNLKVLLQDDEGQTLWVKSVPAPHLKDELGIVTDASALVANTEQLIIEGCRQVANGRHIAAISSGGIGEDGVATDENLKPFGHAIQWNDRRGEAYAQALGQSELGRSYPAILLDFSSSAGKWQWLQVNRPSEIERARHWLTMTDYPLAIWSGTPFMSATLAPRTGCYDVFKRQWIPAFLEHCSAPPMPPIREAGTVVGTLRRGRLTEAGVADETTLLVAGGHDHPVAASAIRRMHPNARIDSMGTADATYGETETLKPDQNLHGLYVTLPISGSQGAAVIGMAEFSVTLGKNCPDVAAFYQSQLRTRDIANIPAGMATALHNLASQTRGFWSAMAQAGVPPAPIFATGGWSRCPALMQMRADVFGEPITIIDEPELVAMGAAQFAAEGKYGAGQAPAKPMRSRIVNPA